MMARQVSRAPRCFGFAVSSVFRFDFVSAVIPSFYLCSRYFAELS